MRLSTVLEGAQQMIDDHVNCGGNRAWEMRSIEGLEEDAAVIMMGTTRLGFGGGSAWGIEFTRGDVDLLHVILDDQKEEEEKKNVIVRLQQ